MLKKLVKYGNSNALILDRAIMELLNMKEGAVVKLQTDGKSLTITPTEAEKADVVALTGVEMLSNIGHEQQVALKADPTKKQLMDQWAPGTENFTKMTAALQPIMFKYMGEIQKLGSPEWTAALDALAIKHQGDKSSEGFMKEFKVLRNQYAPNHQQMQKEMRETYEKMGYPPELLTGNDWE